MKTSTDTHDPKYVGALFKGARDMRKLQQQMRERGLLSSVDYVLRRAPLRLRWWLYYAYHSHFDRSFDRRFGVDTCGVKLQSGLNVTGDNQGHGLEYEPTPVRAFEKMLAFLPADLSNFAFVDFGSGKGRALLLASRLGFRKVVGVEFALELHTVAAKNVAVCRDPARNCRDVEATLQDATTYATPEGPCVFYFYYPFRADVMKKVLANIARSYRESPRKMYFINRLDKVDWYNEVQQVFSDLDFLQPVPETPARFPMFEGPFRMANYESVQ